MNWESGGADFLFGLSLSSDHLLCVWSSEMEDGEREREMRELFLEVILRPRRSYVNNS